MSQSQNEIHSFVSFAKHEKYDRQNTDLIRQSGQFCNQIENILTRQVMQK